MPLLYNRAYRTSRRASLQISNAQVQVSIRVLRINAQSAPIALLGSSRIATFGQQIPKIVVIRRHTRLQRDRFIDQSRAVGKISLLTFEHTQQVKRVGVARVPRHDLQITLLRARKVSPLVQRNAPSHKLRDRLIQ